MKRNYTILYIFIYVHIKSLHWYSQRYILVTWRATAGHSKSLRQSHFIHCYPVDHITHANDTWCLGINWLRRSFGPLTLASTQKKWGFCCHGIYSTGMSEILHFAWKDMYVSHIEKFCAQRLSSNVPSIVRRVVVLTSIHTDKEMVNIDYHWQSTKVLYGNWSSVHFKISIFKWP